jgi:plastocyanin
MVLFVGALFLICGASGAIAISAHGHRSLRRASHTARACHQARRRHCPPARAGKRSSGKHKRRAASKTTTSTGISEGAHPDTPATAALPPAAPGSTLASGAPLSSPLNEGSLQEAPTTPIAPVAPARVQVTAEDSEAFHFTLSRPTVPAGKVIIEFVNHGQDEHNLNALEASEGSLAGSLPNAVPNSHLSLTLNMRPGNYTLFCSLPGHEAKGMRATLVVN